MMILPNCYSYFRMVSDHNCADELTQLLGIQPFSVTRCGETHLANGMPRPQPADWSAWNGCRQDQPVNDVEGQCLRIVRQLHGNIDALARFRRRYQAKFWLEIVPEYVVDAEQNPYIGFSREIIEFCYLTGTEIDVDVYHYCNFCDSDEESNGTLH